MLRNGELRSEPSALAWSPRQNGTLPPSVTRARPANLLEQIAVCAGTFEDDLVVDQLVDEQPIGFDVAFASAFVVADQGMITLALWQWFFVDERRENRLELPAVFSAALHQPQVALELSGIAWYAHQIPKRVNMSSAFSLRTMFSPASVSANVRCVTALGIRTSKGKPRLSLTC